MANTKQPTPQELWDNFNKQIENTLNNLYTQEVSLQNTDTADLTSFMNLETVLESSAYEFGGPLPDPPKPNWQKILTDNPDPHSTSVQFKPIIHEVVFQATGKDENKKVKDAQLLATIKDAFQKQFDIVFNNGPAPGGSDKEKYYTWVMRSIIDLDENLTNDQLDDLGSMLNELVHNTSSLSGPFITGGNTPAAATADPSTKACAPNGETGIWPDTFCPVVYQWITHESADDKKKDKIVESILSTLKELLRIMIRMMKNLFEIGS